MSNTQQPTPTERVSISLFQAAQSQAQATICGLPTSEIERLQAELDAGARLGVLVDLSGQGPSIRTLVMRPDGSSSQLGSVNFHGGLQ